MSSAYTGDVADVAIASEDAGIELTITENNVKTIENEKTINETGNGEVLSASDDNEIAVAEKDSVVSISNPSSYIGLSEEIGSGGNIELAHDYYFYARNPNTISITTPGVIDGKGAIIDMAESNIQTFSVKLMV